MDTSPENRLSESDSHFSATSAWAISFGCIIGWGSFLMPGTTFIPLAGVGGTTIAMMIGIAVMIVFARLFHILLNRTEAHAGGALFGVRKLFGYDHLFICVWTLSLAYISLIWANASAFIVIIRYLFGGVLQWGFHYSVMGFEVWGGEVLATLIIIALYGLASMLPLGLMRTVYRILAVGLLAGVVGCFCLVVARSGIRLPDIGPCFGLTPKAQSVSPAVQVLNIIGLIPWAFSGCESITLSSDEPGFPKRKTFYFLVAAIICGGLVYIILTLQASFALNGPEGSIPVFEAAASALGSAGTVLMAATIFCTLSTSLLGFYRGAGKILYAKAQDGVFPKWFGITNKNGKPKNAILFIMAVSFFIPFFGRTSLSWLTDISTVSMTIVYAYVAACGIRIGRSEGRASFRILGYIGMAVAAVCFLFPLIPNQWTLDNLATGSYAMLIAWSFGGFLLYRSIFQHDKDHHFGSIAVMFFLLFLICFSSTMWMKQLTQSEVDGAMEDILGHYTTELERHSQVDAAAIQAEERLYLADQLENIHASVFINSVVQLLIITITLFLLSNILSTLKKREKQMALETSLAVEKAHRFEIELLERYKAELERTVEERTRDLKREKEKSEQLLLNILPAEVAKELGEHPGRTIAQHFPNVTVLFTDIVGFTKISGDMSAEEVVSMLNKMVTFFDERTKREGIEKIKTIGDAYMAAAGLCEEADNDGAERMVRFAQGLLEDVRKFNEGSEVQIQIRIGINTGDLVAGVIGKAKFIYDVWGDTVNVASRMESTGRPMKIHVTEATFAQTKGVFSYSEDVDLEVKGKGTMKTYYL